MAYKLFLDTDVVIDLLTDRKPFSDDAEALFNLCLKAEVDIYISALSINNIYYIVRKYIGHKKTLMVIRELMSLSEVLPTTKENISQTLSFAFNDFEDAIQYSTVITTGYIDLIITRNTPDYKNSKIAVITPGQFLKSGILDNPE